MADADMPRTATSKILHRVRCASVWHWATRRALASSGRAGRLLWGSE